MTQLSPHFSLEEFTHSQTACRLCMDNTPSDAVLAELAHTAIGMEGVRAILGVPITISSGYRSPQVNRAVGGVPNSQHTLGEAVDFIAPSFGTPLQIVRKIKSSGLHFDQLIQEGDWVHISFGPQMRGEVLTAHFMAGQPTAYTQGA